LNPALVWGEQVILEIKFTGRFPNWFGGLVRIFGLRQCGAAKYVEGVDLLWGGGQRTTQLKPGRPWTFARGGRGVGVA
jgi:hypothetical protein